MSLRRQVELFDANDNSRLVCWLEDDPRLKVGRIITLKGMLHRDWLINRLYKTRLDDADFNRHWKVGGLR